MSKPAQKPDAETQAILEWWDKEHPCRCPLCGSSKIEITCREDVDISTGYFEILDYFECSDCGSKGEYEYE